ncbi:MAG: hypothetical protein IKS90_06600 [Clostridia bacterium]|nr:hypothetical protein [Clostridia bacterium]
MKKNSTFIKNERFAVGTTGKSVHVFGEDGKKLAEFRDLAYAYYSAFTSSSDGLIVKATEGKIALYSLTDLKLTKLIRCGSAPRDGCLCFLSDSTRFLNVAMHEKQRKYVITAYSANELETVYSTETGAILGIECGEDGAYYVLGKDEWACVGIIKDGELIEKYELPFEKSTLYIDALRLRLTGYTDEGYKSTFSALGMPSVSLSLDDFRKADLTIKKRIEEMKTT